jgi:hypothetical protein
MTLHVPSSHFILTDDGKTVVGVRDPKGADHYWLDEKPEGSAHAYKGDLILTVVSGLLDAEITDAAWAMPTTPTVFAPPTVTSSTDAITYEPSTGTLTFNETQAYSMVLSFNPNTTSGRTIYYYVTVDYNDGNGFRPLRYSARQVYVRANETNQVLFLSLFKFPAGTKLKRYVWASDTLNCVTVDLPNTTAGTVTIPAARMVYTVDYGPHLLAEE